MSLSARRAWIEITAHRYLHPYFRVALRKESVDRNTSVTNRINFCHVALRKESVDRNLNVPLLGIK